MCRVPFAWLTMLFLLVGAPKTIGQPANESTATRVLQSRPQAQEGFKKSLVFRRNQNPEAGYLVELKGDSLLILRGGKNESLLYQDITKVMVEREGQTAKVAVLGMFLGMYAGNLLFYTAENQPTAYFGYDGFGESRQALLLANLLFAGAGCLVGYLAGLPLGQKEIWFDLTGSERERQAEWNRLDRLINRKHVNRMHFLVQPAYVYNQVSSNYKEALTDSGYIVYSYDQEPSNFNLLRKLQLTMSLTNKVELGLAAFWLGEPSVYGYRVNPSAYVTQSLKATGYYVIGAYNLFPSWLIGRVNWKSGLGLGLAQVNFNLRSFSYTQSGYSSEIETVSKNLFSGIIFSEVSLQLFRFFSLGIIGDYVWVPTHEGPPLSSAGILAQKLRFGNGSIGITMGLHF